MLSGLWLAVITPDSFEVGRHPIEGLKNPTVARDQTALDVFPIRLTDRRRRGHPTVIGGRILIRYQRCRGRRRSSKGGRSGRTGLGEDGEVGHVALNGLGKSKVAPAIIR
jgi:hypothetical protein